MASQRKAILSAAFGRFAEFDANAQARFGPDAGNTAKAMLATSIEKANQAGFDVVAVDINPKDPADSLERFTTELRRREYDGVNIGYGVRGHKENTELFERLLNEAYKIRPGIIIMFSNGPQDVIAAIQRNFPEAF